MFAACGSGATCLAGCGSANRTFAVAAPAPTPTASATPTPLPTPTPAPTAAPSGNPAALLNYLVDVSRDADTRAYTATTTSQRLGSGDGMTVSAYKQQGGTLFSTGTTGKTTTATLATAPPQGTVTVTVSRQEQLTTDGQVTGYQYFAEDSSGCTQYGSDSIDQSTGRLSASTRFNPPIAYRYDLVPGQSQTVTTQVAQTGYNIVTGAATTANTSTATVTLTFVGVKSVTVPAGTFTAAHVTLAFDYPGYPNATSSYGGTTTIDTAAGVGTVKSVITLSGFADSFTYSSTETDLLTEATVGGGRYPTLTNLPERSGGGKAEAPAHGL